VADGPVNPRRVEVRNPARMTAYVKEVAGYFGAKLVGICPLTPEDMAPGDAAAELAGHTTAVALGVPNAAPSFAGVGPAGHEAAAGRGDLDAAEVAMCLAALIREIGYRARAHFFLNQTVNPRGIAVRSGIGWLDPDQKVRATGYGRWLRLATVTTDLPLAMDTAVPGPPPLRRLAARLRPLPRDPRSRPLPGRRLPSPATRIIGPLGRVDQRDEHHTKAARGDLGPVVQQRWTAESVDPFRRIYFPENRPQNVPMRSWRAFADGPVNPNPRPVSDPAAMAAHIKAVGRFFGADLAGICSLDQSFVFTHRGLRIDYAKGLAGQPIHVPHRFAISLAVQSEYELYTNSPNFINDIPHGKGYLKTARVAVCLAAYIRELGYPAKAHFFINEEVLHVPIAVLAGVGELARNGSLIARDYGPRVRLATVTTDLPLAADGPVDIGVQALCDMCDKCAINCPARCIPLGPKAVVRGVEKWQLDNDKCMTYWTANPQKFNSCARCIAVCPWNMPPRWSTSWMLRGLRLSKVYRRLFLWLENRVRGAKPNPPMEFLWYRAPGGPGDVQLTVVE
jgi:ferredoxin